MLKKARLRTRLSLTVPPERADLVLPSYIPNGERDVLIFYGLNIETLI